MAPLSLFEAELEYEMITYVKIGSDFFAAISSLSLREIVRPVVAFRCKLSEPIEEVFMNL
jgi:hypothetical protein